MVGVVCNPGERSARGQDGGTAELHEFLLIFSDEAERIYQEKGMEAFLAHETQNAEKPLPEGPFAKLLYTIQRLQQDEAFEKPPVRTALVTARSMPAHERVIRTLHAWKVHLDEAFFLGGVSKVKILEAFRPHIFFDDQAVHCEPASAVVAQAEVYAKSHFIIRSRLYSGLRRGTMSIGSIVDDERLKLVLAQACAYCGSQNALSMDHVLPRSRGGEDSGDNIVWSCRSCNSSKGSTDLLEWMVKRGKFPPLLLLRRYLKLAISSAEQQRLMQVPYGSSAVADEAVPFSLAAIPLEYPQPRNLVLWTVRLDQTCAKPLSSVANTNGQ